jgi:predicted transposase/invertase (TIGR01784 family)
MGFDNVCKRLAELFPQDFAVWLMGEAVSFVEILKTELSGEAIRADSVLLLRLADSILHIEFETTAQSDPPLPLRMLDYWVRLYRQYGLPIHQFVIVLDETSSEIPTELQMPNTWHRYHVNKLWEQPPTNDLTRLGILPLVPLMQSAQPEQLLRQTAQALELTTPTWRKELMACAYILAGLRFKPELIKAFLEEDIVRESVTYQEIGRKGEMHGELKGELKGELRGELKIILRVLNQRLGNLPAVTQQRITNLDLPQLDALSQALLDFKSKVELNDWLKRNA